MQIRWIYNAMTLLKPTPKKKRNNESAPSPWMNGSCIGRLTSRRYFATMDEKDWMKLSV
jgi:hypothetical protein